MKKIIRIASVIALASASLLYVGCTKDFSADLAKTNSEVAAQASKVAALEATVQTINSTVENLKTTKADAAAVNALKEDLESKINTLTSALEQTALLAASAKADAEAVAADLEVEKAKLDSIILVVDTLAIKSDSLRKDVDSLYKNSASMANDIKKLTGRVEGLESRITSLVAIPSLTEEIAKYDIDTIFPAGATTKSIDAAIFTAKFAVTPKDAKIDAKDLGLIIKEGLTKAGTAHESIDSVYKVTSAVFENGILTVSTKVGSSRNDVKPADGNQIYYSLCFNGKDANGTEYSKFSEFVAAKSTSGTEKVDTKLKDVVKFVFDGKAVAEKTFADTISYAETKDTVFKTSLNGYGKVMAEINGAFITLDEFATILGTKASKLAIDSCQIEKVNKRLKANNEYVSVDFNGIKDEGHNIFVKNPSITNSGLFGNYTAVTTTIKVGHSNDIIATLKDSLYIGGKNLGTVKLGTSTEPWYYVFAKKGASIADEFSIKDTTAAKRLDEELVVENKDGKFTLSKVDAKGVKVEVEGVKYATVAADTTYNVEWATKYDLSKKADSTFTAFNWALKVGPRPADPATIKYAVDTTVRGTKSITAKFKIYANSIAAIDELDNRVEFGTPVIKSITINGKALDFKKNDPANRFSFDSVEDGIVTFKNAAEGTTVVVATADCAGITFTYEFTLNLTKGKTPTFKALSTYVEEKDGKYVVSVSAPKIEKKRDTRWPWDNYNYQGRYVESLNTIPFNQLFVVDTTNFASKDVFAAFDRNVDSTASEIKAHESFFTLPGNLNVTADKVTFEKGTTDIAWGTYDSLQVNVIAYLVLPGEKDEYNDTIDQIDINFWTAEPIKSVEHVDSTISHNNTKGDVVDLAGLFTMKDYNDSTVWANGKPYAKGTFYYGQEIEFAQDVKKWTINGDIAAGTLTIEGTVLTLAPQGADIKKPVTVEIPFVVKHDLDQYGTSAADRQGTVKVTFTSEK